MNGRVQDAITGRFLSPDPYITEPGNTQNFNRYGYVYNNPMSLVDPSGFTVDCLEGSACAGGTDQLHEVVVYGSSPPTCDDDCRKRAIGDSRIADLLSRFGQQPLVIPDVNFGKIPMPTVSVEMTQTQQQKIKTSQEVKDFICGTLAHNGYNRDRAEVAAYKYRNDKQHPEHKFEPVARAGENWLTAASFNTYYPGGNFNSYKVSIYAWQYLKLIPGVADPRDDFSQEALDAGLDGHEHLHDSPEQLRELCRD
jgi:hypothetical protein